MGSFGLFFKLLTIIVNILVVDGELLLLLLEHLLGFVASRIFLLLLLSVENLLVLLQHVHVTHVTEELANELVCLRSVEIAVLGHLRKRIQRALQKLINLLLILQSLLHQDRLDVSVLRIKLGFELKWLPYLIKGELGEQTRSDINLCLCFKTYCTQLDVSCTLTGQLALNLAQFHGHPLPHLLLN